MPLYEYQCISCANQFEVRRGFYDESEVICPRCKVGARRILSPVPIVFKGQGFYTTDNRKNGSKPEESGDPSCS
jgi:putative FmdB family regulatory protein